MFLNYNYNGWWKEGRINSKDKKSTALMWGRKDGTIKNGKLNGKKNSVMSNIAERLVKKRTFCITLVFLFVWPVLTSVWAFNSAPQQSCFPGIQPEQTSLYFPFAAPCNLMDFNNCSYVISPKSTCLSLTFFSNSNTSFQLLPQQLYLAVHVRTSN